MKNTLIYLFVISFLFIACNNQKKNEDVTVEEEKIEKAESLVGTVWENTSSFGKMTYEFISEDEVIMRSKGANVPAREKTFKYKYEPPKLTFYKTIQVNNNFYDEEAYVVDNAIKREEVRDFIRVE